MTMASGRGGNPNPEKRGEVKGWTKGAANRQRKALFSVDAGALTGEGWAITLTLRTLPSSEEWGRIRRAWQARVERTHGFIRMHWVVEWQERGHPHLHVAVYGEGWDLGTAWVTVGDWLEVARDFRPSIAAQYVTRIDGPVGWLGYMSKHAARGAEMYQRSGKPEGWEKTGRLYGFRGPWPFEEPELVELTVAGGYRFRRMARAWRIADARAALLALPSNADPFRVRAARRRLTSARGALRCPDPRLSAVRGVAEWMPETTTGLLVALLKLDGEVLPERSDEERTRDLSRHAWRLAAHGDGRRRAEALMADLGFRELTGA